MWEGPRDVEEQFKLILKGSVEEKTDCKSNSDIKNILTGSETQNEIIPKSVQLNIIVVVFLNIQLCRLHIEC